MFIDLFLNAYFMWLVKTKLIGCELTQYRAVYPTILCTNRFFSPCHCYLLLTFSQVHQSSHSGVHGEAFDRDASGRNAEHDHQEV